MIPSTLGAALPRVEDPALLRGQKHFIDDLDLPHQLHAWFLRSPHAHARVVAMDASQALAMDGVAAVFFAADLATDGPTHSHPRVALKNIDGSSATLPPRPLLASQRVRHVGDSVAMVLADTRDRARDAAECIEVDYEELTAVTDAAEAMANGAPILHVEANENRALHWRAGDAETTDSALRSAHHVARVRVVNNRVVIAPMEPRGVLASYDPGNDRYTVYAPSQGAHEIKVDLANTLGVPAAAVHVITPEVGGAFGIKIPSYPEYALCAWASRRLARPVKWYGERSDAFLTDGQGRDHVMDAELGLTADGRFLGIRCHTISNTGAYGSGTACTIPTAGGTRCMTGVYRIPTWCVDVQVVYTNTVPVLAYRGAGKPEYNYMVERLIDVAARDLNLDPAELRARNVVRASEMPYATGTGLVFDSGEFEHNMRRALELANRDDFETRRHEARARGRLRGLGFALFQEPDGFLDNRVSLVFDPQGTLTMTLTGQSGGQGFETTFGQVLAHSLGLDAAHVRVRQGDSDIIGPGRGTGGSRTATVASGGIVRAGEKIVAKAKRIAAHLFEASEQDLSFDAGRLNIAGTDRSMDLTDIAIASFDGARIPSDMEPGLEASFHYLAREYNYPCGCHVCEVEIDPETGCIAILSYVAVNDHGQAINPMLLDGQIHGGVVQGIGQALYENCHYDAQTGQLVSGSFMDYCLPRAADFPAFEIHHAPVPSRTNPLGVKGVGESGCTAACPTLVNAVIDALAPIGVTQVDMPMTPENIWRRIQSAASKA